MTRKELESTPSLPALYPRALAGATMKPVLKRVPGIGGRFGGKRELPDTELVVSDVDIDRDHLAAYDKVCGFHVSDVLPATYPHMLAFPLQMQIMTANDFPFPVIGLVHIRNRIEHMRPITDDETLSMRVWADDMESHPKGTQFAMYSEAEVDGVPAWRSMSVYLRKGEGASGDGDKKDSSGGGDRDEPPEPNAQWDVPDDIGRRYAKVSGDINPIHMHRASAMAFGLPRAIAHGMWSKARCLAALEGTLPDAFTVDVSFKLPVLLPAKVAFATWEEDGGRAFTLTDAKKGKPHLSGTAEPI